MILIGSRALAIQSPKLLLREPKDFDFVCTESELDLWLKDNISKVKPTKMYPIKNKVIVEGQVNCEFEIVKEDTSSKLLYDLVLRDKKAIRTKQFGVIPNLDLLFTIKSSHKYLKNSPHFWKNVVDYHMMKNNGAQVLPEYQEFLKLREKETYTYNHPKLNQSKESFFSDDNINYVWDHDSIHESVATFDRPAYTYYIKDGQAVQCDKDKFFSLPQEVRLAGVVEEAAVLAIERSLVPHPGKWDPKYAWKFALSKVCTSITSNWFREFSYDYVLDILKLYPSNYWEKFQEDIRLGNVRPFNGQRY